MMRCFYLKLGKSNSLANDWLEGKNPLNRPAVVIFFGRSNIEDIRSSRSDPQAKAFYESSLPEERDHTLMIVVGHGKAWFLKPIDEIVEHDDPTDTENLWKIMPVEIRSVQRVNQIPPILAGINANTYLGRGTYREINNQGNIKAIYCSLKIPLPTEYLMDENCNAARLLECLSSVELETLTAKVFEAAGCFVPAYRGGCVKDVDLFAHNDNLANIKLSGLTIPSKGSLSIQVKGWTPTPLRTCPSTVDCLIGLNVVRSPNCFDSEWLLDQARAFPNVASWLKRSLDWLPQEFTSKCGL
jgi:hypothetical protein